jgi:magnesium chelatase family protein
MLGIDGYVVRVEADSSPGSPALAIIGLPDRALNESRVRTAIFNSGFAYPAGRLLINLSPADVRTCSRPSRRRSPFRRTSSRTRRI